MQTLLEVICRQLLGRAAKAEVLNLGVREPLKGS